MKKAVLLIILSLHGLAFAQAGSDPSMVYEMATENNIFSGVRAAGMGGAQIAAGEDGSALWYNPALLTRIRRMELSGSLMHQRFFNETKYGNTNGNQFQLNKTRLSSIWGVFPVPTDQGGLSIAIAANRIKSFDRLFRFESTTGWLTNPDTEGFGGGEDDIGSLWVYSVGGGIELSRHVSVGAAIDIYNGSDDYSYFIDEIYDSVYESYAFKNESDYSGFSGRFGLAYSASPSFHLGLTVKLPADITIEQNIFEDGYLTDRGKYKYRMPFSFGLGSMYANRRLLLALDFNYTDYTQLEYLYGVEYGDELSVRNVYKDVLSINAGAEYMFPSWGLTLRAGYCYDPIPFTYYPIDDDLDIFTVGFGYLLDKSLKLDVAFNLLNWTRRDNDFLQSSTTEKYKAQRLFVGFTYRI